MAKVPDGYTRASSGTMIRFIIFKPDFQTSSDNRLTESRKKILVGTFNFYDEDHAGEVF